MYIYSVFIKFTFLLVELDVLLLVCCALTLFVFVLYAILSLLGKINICDKDFYDLVFVVSSRAPFVYIKGVCWFSIEFLLFFGRHFNYILCIYDTRGRVLKTKYNGNR